ncbi:MAG: MraY family glycosyltransferase [Desulfobulbaceae bacterium]|jgi:Fuc2NAc and GlcNAc transferase
MATLSLLAASFVLSFGLTGALRWYALKAHLLDIPNRRSSHAVPVPRGGGLAVVLVFTAGLLVSAAWQETSLSLLAGLLAPLIMVAAVGWLDDHRSIPALVRLLVHVLAAGLALFFLPDLPPLPLGPGQILPALWGYPLVLLALAWAINLHNFMDGIDGIASVEAMCVAGGAAVILWLDAERTAPVFPLLLLAAATAGFLVWNWPPARIFMGDAGSGFLGLAIGLFALITSAGDGINLWSWLILYGFFAVDATCTLVRRFLRREKLHEAHRSHAYQILARRWRSHRKVTCLVLAINIFWLFPLAVVSSRCPEWAAALAAAALAPLVFWVIRVGAGTTDE